MTKEQKELLALGTSYLDIFISELKDKKMYTDVLEMYEFIRLETFKAHDKNQKLAIESTKTVCEKIEDILKGDELEANPLAVAIACFMELNEDKIFKLSRGMKFNRLTWAIYNDLESSQMGTVGFKNSMNLIYKLKNYKGK